MDGLEAVTAITEMGVKTPVVALTANVMSDAVELYEQSGMTDTVGKPFTAKELWHCLIKYFANENRPKFVTGKSTEQAAQGVTGFAAAKQSAHDSDIDLERLQQTFIQSNQDTHANISDALKSGDMKTAHRLVHSLKSNAGYIMESRLQETCDILESLLVQDSPPAALVEGYMEDIKSELWGIFEKIERQKKQ
jgi:HPt (histidine-containing phosphotransfer) domain-containing protein